MNQGWGKGQILVTSFKQEIQPFRFQYYFKSANC